MTTMKLELHFKPHAWESADYIYNDHRVAGLLDEAHRSYPDFDGDGLASATELVVQRLETLHIGRYPAEDWTAIRTMLSDMVCKSLLLDREIAQQPRP